MKNCLLAEKIRVLMSKVSVKAYAEEVVKEPEVKESPKKEEKGGKEKPDINYEDLIATARREEKDKLYPQIDTLKAEVKTKTETINANLLKIASLEKELSILQDDKEGSKELKRLNDKVAELQAIVDNQPEVIDEAEYRSKIESEVRAVVEAEYEVKLYKTEKLNELKDVILPTFADMINGDTKEALDSSIEWAKEKTLETKKALGIDVDNPSPKDASTPSRPSVTNPSNSIFEQKIDADYIRGLSADSEEFAQLRKTLGLDKNTI